MARSASPVAAATRRVACPLCGAGQGERCVTISGERQGQPVSVEHGGRYDAARAAGYLPLRGGTNG